MNKILTFYSDTHKILYEDYFLKSYKKHLSNDFKLLEKKIEQISPSGDFASFGFDLTMLEKIKWILENIDLEDEGYLVFADCDIQFFGNLEFDLRSHDILFQHDYYDRNYCAGFFVCKQNEKVLNFFNMVYDEFKASMNGKIDDQYVINNILKNRTLDLSSGFLPSDKYWTVAFSTNGNVWSNQPVTCPKTVIMHHANFTIGVDNKIALMDIVKNILEENER
jgi:hypothetical protein